jgi:predicted dehydrogenase
MINRRVLRLGVIGVGRYALAYHLPLIKMSPEAELVAIHRRSADALAQAAAEFDVPHTFTDHLALLDGVDLDAVIVSGPEGIHHEYCMSALERGLHVLVDKPWVLRSADAEEQMALARDKGVVLAIAYNRHLDSANMYAREIIQSGRLGQVIHASALQLGFPAPEASPWQYTPGLGGGPLYGRGAHMADLLPWTTGLRPSEVSATLVHQPGLATDVGGSVTMRLGDAVTAHMDCFVAQDHNRDEARYYGTEGSLFVYRPVRRSDRPRKAIGIGVWAVEHWDQVGEPIEPLTLPEGSTTVDHFLAVVQGREESRCGGEEGIIAVRVLEAAYESARSGQMIRLK